MCYRTISPAMGQDIDAVRMDGPSYYTTQYYEYAINRLKQKVKVENLKMKLPRNGVRVLHTNHTKRLEA